MTRLDRRHRDRPARRRRRPAREAGGAARIARPHRDDVIDLFDNRAMIEGAAIAKLGPRRHDPRRPLSGAPGPARTRPHRRAVREGRHRVPPAAGDRSAQRAPDPMHARLMGEIELCIGQVQAQRLRSAREVAADHQGILDAVTAGDAELAARLIRTHIGQRATDCSPSSTRASEPEQRSTQSAAHPSHQPREHHGEPRDGQAPVPAPARPGAPPPVQEADPERGSGGSRPR